MRDLFRLAHAPQGDARGHFLQRLGFHAPGHFGLDEARRNARDADTVARQFLGPDHGQRRDTGLGRGVVGLPHVAGAGDRRDIDDQPLAAQLDHLRCHFAGTQEHTGQVDVDHRLPLAQGHLLDLAIPGLEQQAVAQDAGVVDQPVDGAEVAGHLADHGAHLVFVGHVADIGAGVAAGGLAGADRLVQAALVQVDQRQARAAPRQVFSHCPTQALAAAGDDDHAVLQLHITTPVFVLGPQECNNPAIL